MKKVLILILILAMVLAFSACGKKEQAQPSGPSFEEILNSLDENGRFVDGKAEISATAGEETVVRSNSYTEDLIVTVSGTPTPTNPAIIRFINCEFKNGMTLKADANAIVIVESDCVVSGGELKVDSKLKEATDDTELCKIISMVPADFASDNAAGFMIYDSDTLVLNGTTFTRDYAEYSYSEADGYVKKVPGEYNMFYVAQWWENGVWKTFTCVQAV